MRASSAKLRHWLALLKSVTPMCVANPRSSCTTRSTKNMSPGNCLTPIFFKGESGSKGSTLEAANRSCSGRDITLARCHVSSTAFGCRHGYEKLEGTVKVSSRVLNLMLCNFACEVWGGWTAK